MKRPIKYYLINTLLLINIVLLIIGLTSPIMTLVKFKWIENSFSISSGIKELYGQGQYVLFAIILMFSVIIPFLKWVFLVLSWNTKSNTPTQQFMLHWMVVLARWSMLDVMVVAVLVAMVKINLIAEINTHMGLNYFCIAVFMLMGLSMYIHKQSRKQP